MSKPEPAVPEREPLSFIHFYEVLDEVMSRRTVFPDGALPRTKGKQFARELYGALATAPAPTTSDYWRP
jgi:hypothetical protein